MLPIPPRRKKKPTYHSASFIPFKELGTEKNQALISTLELHEAEDGRLIEKKTLKKYTCPQTVKENNSIALSNFNYENIHFADDVLKSDDENEDGDTIKLDEVTKVQRLKEIEAFLQFRSEFLNETLRLDGRGGIMVPNCCLNEERRNSEVYRCLDCFDVSSYCKACIVQSHKHNPLHRIESWCGFWKKDTLERVGLAIQLGHSQNHKCIRPAPLVKPLVIVHTNGIHRVRHFFCSCGEEVPKRVQLVRKRWFPATQSQPATAFTFDVLDQFLSISYRGKTNAHDFCSSLENLTNGCGLDVPSRYDEFLRVSREYAHLLLLKRGGRGHIIKGPESTDQGELAVSCPVCPQPGKNMPNGWESVGENEKWIYGMNLAIDANFRLKLKERGVTDPELGPGWAYFVNEENYKAEIIKHPQPQEKSDCTSTHQAIERATSRMNEGYSVTGIGAVICSRHGLVRPNGVGDLQRGERYANMDYIFLSSIKGTSIKNLNISYDIACQWSRNLAARVSKFPVEMQESFHAAAVQYFVPKFHLPAHGEKCQGPYSLNLRPGVGRTDGEGIERGWSIVNPLATMLREMGPGFRHDTFDNHWSALNWSKVMGLGKSLRTKLTSAVYNSIKHNKKHKELTSARETSTIAKWSLLIDNWLANPFDNPNPFDDPPASQSLADVRRQLAVEEDNLDWEQENTHALADSSPSDFIYAGLELEQQIINFNALEKPKDTGSKKISSWHDKQTAIQRKAAAWIELQTTFMPVIATFALSRPLSKPSASLKLEDSIINIFLPSSLRSTERAQLRDIDASGCDLFVSSEKALRAAQLDDSLSSIKRLLKSKTSTKDYTRRNVFGQRGNTRAQTAFKRLEKKIKQQADRYRRAYCALLVLEPDGQWRNTYQQLENADLRLPVRRHGTNDESEEEDGDKENNDPVGSNSRRVLPRSRKRKRQGEGHRTDSWIWGSKRTSLDNEMKEAEDDILRVLWARGKARGDRWTEEVVIVLEEMRRALAYCDWKSDWWQARKDIRSEAEEVMDGISAYALKQSYLWTTLGNSFANEWAPIIRRYNLPSDWPSSYRDRVPNSFVSENATDRKWVLRVKEALRLASCQPTYSKQQTSADDSSSSDSDF